MSKDRKANPRRIVIRRRNTGPLLISMIALVCIVALILVALYSTGPSNENPEDARIATQSEPQPTTQALPTPERVEQPRSTPIPAIVKPPQPQIAPTPVPVKVKSQVKQPEPPRVPKLIPCVECDATGLIKGDKAVEWGAKILAAGQVMETAKMLKSLGEPIPSQKAMEKQFEDHLAIATAQLKLTAARRRRRGEVFTIACPICSGSKWVKNEKQ